MPEPAAPGAPAAPPPAPWHAGIDAALIGMWQNKGYDIAKPETVAVEASKAFNEAQRLLGAPPAELLRMPKPDAQPTERSAFWQRLGVPDKPEGYDFSAIKYENGKELEQQFVDALRSTFARAYVPKEAAAEVTRSVVKFLEGEAKTERDLKTAKVADEKAALQREWGPNFEPNRLQAMQGAMAAGFNEEQLNALADVVGYKGIWEMMFRFGAGKMEPKYVDGTGAPRAPATAAAAQARLQELYSDQDFLKRYFAGSKVEVDQVNALNEQVLGISRAEELAKLGRVA